MVTRDVIEEYTKYIDPSEMIIEYYKNQATAGLEKYFLQIEDWLASDSPEEKNKPLVIQADEGVGKKTLLAQWMKYHQEKNKKNFPDLIISHFAGTEGNNENYFYAIYKILVRLREHFNVSQKVELLEDKLERYFHYWLDVCSRALIGRIVDDSTIILVFEGINLLKDPDTREEANVGLWLPKSFPNRIRVIITAESDSGALRHFEKIGCEIIAIENNQVIPSSLISGTISRPSFIIDDDYKQRIVQILNKKPPEVLRNSLFIKTFLSTLLPYPSDRIIKENEINKEEFKSVFQKMDFQKLERINTISEFNSFILEYFSHNIMDTEKFRGVLVALNITEKGLSQMEILTLTGISEKDWRHVVGVFKTFLMKYKDLWKINNETFKKAIRVKYTNDDSPYALRLHSNIADVLNKRTSNSIRKLEEETFHLFMSKNYFKLKEAVSNIENFLLLFNPNNKYDLCRYWQILEQRGFDPSSEYTKAVEGFELYYRPNQEDTFMIILQVSRFLKEFSDFETNFTPQFRHPPIRGGTELKEIGLRREIKKLGMYQPEEWEPEDEEMDELEELEHKLAIEFPDYSDTMIKETAQQIHEATFASRQSAAARAEKQNEQKQAHEGGELKPAEESAQAADKKTGKGKEKQSSGSRDKKNELFLLTPIEALNVDIPDNRAKFRASFGGHLNKKSDKVVVDKENKKEKYLDDDDEPITQTKKEEGGEQKAFFKKGTLVSAGGPLEERKDADNKDIGGPIAKRTPREEERTEVDPTFYYYKRWLWMMFPWVCLSSKNNYSKIIYECFSSATEYISVSDEREKTRQALKIAIEAKMKKQSMYTKGDISQLTSTRFNRNDTNASNKTTSKKTLPPLVSNQTLAENLMSSTLRLDTLSPPNAKLISKKAGFAATTTSKDAKFFITSQAPLQAHYLNETTGEPSMIDKAAMTSNTTFQNMSLLNRTNNKDRSMISLASNKKVEEMLKNANEAIQTLLLPKYQDSLLITSNRQVDDLEGKVKQLQTQNDELVYMNKVSDKKLKDLNIVEANLRAEGVGDVVIKAQNRLDELDFEIKKAEAMKLDAVKQGERLSKIIAICVKNKSQNELGVQSLNYLLTNFIKMIGWEKESLTASNKNATDLEKLSKQYIQAYEDRMKQHQRAIKHIKQEKMTSFTVERQLDNVYGDLEKTAIVANEDMKKAQIAKKEAQERKTKSEAAKEKAKNAKENLEEMREMYDKVEKTVGVQFEDSKFIGFLDYIEKMNDFQKSIYESENENEKLKEEMIALSSFLETLKKAKSTHKEVDDKEKAFYLDLNDKDQLSTILLDKRRSNEAFSREIAKRTQFVLNSKMVLSKLCKELNVPFEGVTIETTNIPVDQIVEKYQSKVQAVKENVPIEEFETLQKGEPDLTKHYKEQNDEYEIEKRFSVDENEDLPEPNVFRKGAKFIEANYD